MMTDQWPIGDDNMPGWDEPDDWQWNDGLTEDEAREAADRWRQGVAADLTPHDLEELREYVREGKVPRRKLVRE